jgi:WhiB family transcriptional regulator, redox-sensing transcriptional regulator
MTRPDHTRRDAPMATGLTIPGKWTQQALCAQAFPDAWYPDRNQRELIQLAKQICARCPVQAVCLQHALSGADSWGGISTGIWGGTAAQERSRLRRQLKAEAA